MVTKRASLETMTCKKRSNWLGGFRKPFLRMLRPLPKMRPKEQRERPQSVEDRMVQVRLFLCWHRWPSRHNGFAAMWSGKNVQ